MPEYNWCYRIGTLCHMQERVTSSEGVYAQRSSVPGHLRAICGELRQASYVLFRLLKEKVDQSTSGALPKAR